MERGAADFDGSVAAFLGALGVVSRLELDVEPSYEVSQEARTGLSWRTLEDRFDDITAAAYSVSIFTRSAAVTRSGSPPGRRRSDPPTGSERSRPRAPCTCCVVGQSRP